MKFDPKHDHFNIYNAEIFVYKPWMVNKISIWNNHEYLCYESTAIWIFFFSAGTVYRRQILIYKDGPRVERVGYFIIIRAL